MQRRHRRVGVAVDQVVERPRVGGQRRLRRLHARRTRQRRRHDEVDPRQRGQRLVVPLQAPRPQPVLEDVGGYIAEEQELLGVELRRVVRARADDVREPAALLVPHDQQHEGNEIESETAADAQHEGGCEQHQELAVRRQAEAERLDLGAERQREHDDRQQHGWAVDVIDRWPPLAWAALAACLAFLLRLPYVTVPLTADEGGYAEVARLWARGAALYDRVDGIWVDRPQGLLW